MSHIEKEIELLSNCRLVTVGADKMMYNEDEWGGAPEGGCSGAPDHSSRWTGR